MNSESQLITQESYDKIEKELEYLKSTKRAEIAEHIKVALSFGDISENAEYDEAKNEQAQLEERILKLENILRTSVIIDESKLKTDQVNLGSKVKVKIDGEVENITIVGKSDSDPSNGKISTEAPIGKALLNKMAGDKMDVNVPDGVLHIEVIEVTR